ncbi:MAG: radical SAM protein [Candidatus Methanomethylicaceae archaeon]
MGKSNTTIRVSYGTAIELGLIKGIQKTPPTTAYFFIINNKCKGNCKFCPQSIKLSNKISRIDWLEFEIEDVINKIKKKRMKRICLQLADEENIIFKVMNFISNIKDLGIPISISTSPSFEILNHLIDLKNYIDILTIPIDCANEELFKKIKGRDWNYYWNALNKALEIFGPWKIGTHIIVGLGETEEEIVKLLLKCKEMKILPSLFAFTPIPGTELEKMQTPNISSYRRIQLVRELIFNNEEIEFYYDNLRRIREIKVKKDIVERILENGEAFMTKGCPDCNRPYFNERVSGVIYNYPKKLTINEKEKVRRELFAENFKISN